MLKKVLLVTGAVLLAGTGVASAQGYDDPPGWAFQRRKIIEDHGYHPGEHRYQGHYRYHGHYGAYRAYGYAPRRSHRYSPPGARYQDRRLREERGSRW